jgi:carbon-monoxide dehydrogenase medium subunit
MKPAPFDYARPESIAEVLAALAEANGDAKLVAGGQSLIPLMALRMASPSLLIDIARVPELKGIDISPDGTRIGALTRWREIERHKELGDAQPLLATAVKHVAHYQIRTRGTIGGSCAHADPASEIPAVALTCEATFEIASVRGTRIVSAEHFFVGTLTTALEPDELLIAVRFPQWPADRRYAFQEFARRSGDFALAGCVVFFDLEDDGRCRAPHIGVFGVDDRPRRLAEVEAALVGQHLTSDVIAAASNLAAHVIAPQDDLHAPADYRRALLGVLLERALTAAIVPQDLAA